MQVHAAPTPLRPTSLSEDASAAAAAPCCCVSAAAQTARCAKRGALESCCRRHPAGRRGCEPRRLAQAGAVRRADAISAAFTAAGSCRRSVSACKQRGDPRSAEARVGVGRPHDAVPRQRHRPCSSWLAAAACDLDREALYSLADGFSMLEGVTKAMYSCANKQAAMAGDDGGGARARRLLGAKCK